MTRARSSLLSRAFELLSSMRFAVSLLVFVCLASVVGTLVPQNAARVTYVDQFGELWTSVFDAMSLFQVYNAWWFLVVMGFLVLSTSLCLIRNTPKMLRDMRTFKEHVQRNGLRAISHRVNLRLNDLSLAEAQATATEILQKDNYQLRVRESENTVLLAAKRGTKNRLGYIFAHASIILICIGGLLDSELLVRMQVWFGGKQPIYQDMAIADVPDSGALSLRNPSFRGNMFIPEGVASSNAVLLLDGGSLVQPLPFALKLKKFHVEYYSTGMPKSFVSEVEVTDLASGKQSQHTIRVNEPLQTHGVTIYQSSLADGGSQVSLNLYPILGKVDDKFPVKAKVGSTVELGSSAASPVNFTLEITDFTLTNVEQMGGNPDDEKTKVFRDHVASVTSSATKKDDKHFQNVGPSVSYKLRDKSGQAFEYKVYMNPIELEGQGVFLMAVRPEGQGEFRYLRVPADEQQSMNEYLALRDALLDPQMRQKAVHAFVATQTSISSAEQAQLSKTVEAMLKLFSEGGVAAISEFLQKNVDPSKQAEAASAVASLLENAMHHLWLQSRLKAGLAPLEQDVSSVMQQQRWVKAATAALSDSYVFPSPVLVQLTDFDMVQASVLQVSRTPGKWLVYLGSLFLILGVFAMFYIRERRAWVYIEQLNDGQLDFLFALTTTRRGLDFEKEFERLKQSIEQAFASTTRSI